MPQTATGLVDAVAALEARMEAVEAALRDTPASSPHSGGRWWLLDKLAENTGPGFLRDDVSGSLAYGGRVSAPGVGTVVRQIEHPIPDVLEADLGVAANVLGALGHPLRLKILRRLLLGARTLSDLQEIPDSGTTGQLHHHLRELRGAGLVISRRRNDYAIPSERAVTVLVIVAASLGRDLNPPE